VGSLGKRGGKSRLWVEEAEEVTRIKKGRDSKRGRRRSFVCASLDLGGLGEECTGGKTKTRKKVWFGVFRATANKTREKQDSKRKSPAIWTFMTHHPETKKGTCLEETKIFLWEVVEVNRRGFRPGVFVQSVGESGSGSEGGGAKKKTSARRITAPGIGREGGGKRKV